MAPLTVRFDGNVGNGLGWSFRPVQREVKVKLGAVTTVEFEAESENPAEMQQQGWQAILDNFARHVEGNAA